MEHIIVRIIGFNQAELFLGFLEHPSFPLVETPFAVFSPFSFIALHSNQSLLLVNTIHKLCNIKLENPKNAIRSFSMQKQQKAYELKSELLP
jgi:hypothetical protein